ncbi:Chaperone protein dnaJ 15 [Platanthera guangdongensis]|uniref:Chaperone protein dnaJ 15 n=1 Tax=Platanthera guangdongensis TaxID=2320717 RepID=A0ABR2LPT0_9ASPA
MGIDLSNLGTVNTMFASLFSKLGVVSVCLYLSLFPLSPLSTLQPSYSSFLLRFDVCHSRALPLQAEGKTSGGVARASDPSSLPYQHLSVRLNKGQSSLFDFNLPVASLMDRASDVAYKLEQALEINLKKHDAIGSWEMHKFLSHSSHNILRMHSLILQGQYSASNRHWKRYLYPRGYLSYNFDSFSSEKLQSSFLQDPDYQLYIVIGIGVEELIKEVAYSYSVYLI